MRRFFQWLKESNAASEARHTAHLHRLTLRINRAGDRLLPLRIGFWVAAGLNVAIFVGVAYPPLHRLADWFLVDLPQPIQAVVGVLIIVVMFAGVFVQDTTSRGRVRLARRFAGLCPACGYDVQATPERCSECGADLTAPTDAVARATPALCKSRMTKSE